jgi:hypothetical protein
MKLTLEIEMDNDAFSGYGQAHYEAARILSEAAYKIEHGAWAFPLLDSNGNKVGEVKLNGAILK